MTVTHIPFGVDSAFWVPAPDDSPAAGEDYVLSIGNDSHRDYGTLLQAWKPEYPLLRVVTAQDIAPTGRNVEVLRGGWHEKVLTDEEIRGLIQGARFVILPIKETIQPSGQSACLQAMACGKAVAITDFQGLWSRHLLRDGATCILCGAPGDQSGIQRAVERLLADPTLVAMIGINARRLVESDLNVDKMAEAIEADLQTFAACR